MRVLGGEAEIEVEADFDVEDDGGLIAPAWDLNRPQTTGNLHKVLCGAVKEMVN